MAACISPEAGRLTGSVREVCKAMAARVCYVLLLSVLLAAAVSPGRAAPIETTDGEILLSEWKVVEVDQSDDMENLKAVEENSLTGPQNGTQLESQPEAEIVQEDGTNVNTTQEIADYDDRNSEDEQEYESEEPWWEEEDDWMETDSVAKELKEDGDSKAEKPLWETWFDAVPKTESPQWDLKAPEEVIGEKPQEWEKSDVKADKVADEAPWWAWPVTMKPWWGAETKAERPWWEEEEKAKEPWWERGEEVKIPQDFEWFPTKKQDEAKKRLEDPDEYDALDVYIDDDVDTDDVLEERPVQKEIFPPEMREHKHTEKSGSVYFWAFLVTLAILVAVLSMVYHKKRLSQQKRFIFALEGGLFGDKKRPNSGEYQKLDNKI
ncbi:uncharacterized protein LOC143774987 [Ranitomeya variabilis]|uniref:uncharacterized protein LOC143774987 n=1 Tax=Ranitomeya variabilis TaxID=490064 RepID=UPI0040572107